jgi:hypothetical protein
LASRLFTSILVDGTAEDRRRTGDHRCNEGVNRRPARFASSNRRPGGQAELIQLVLDLSDQLLRSFCHADRSPLIPIDDPLPELPAGRQDLFQTG